MEFFFLGEVILFLPGLLCDPSVLHLVREHLSESILVQYVFECTWIKMPKRKVKVPRCSI